MTALLVALAGCLVVGALADRALLGDPSRGVIERCGRALMLGLGLVGTLSMVVDGLGLGVSRTSVGVGLLLLLGVLAPGLRARRRTDGVARPEAQGRLGGAHVALLALAGASLFFVVRSGWIRPTFQFDALVRWMFKAKVLHFDGTLIGSLLSTDPQYAFTHQRYPPLVSHVANLPALVSGSFDDRIASAMFPWFAVALTAVVYGALRRRAGRLTGALGAAWIANLPLLAYIIVPPPGAGASSAMADIPLSLFACGAVLALADALDGRRDRAHLEAGLLLGFAALTKNEGLPLVAALALGALVGASRGRWRRAAGVAALGTGVFVLVWGRLAAHLPALDENYPAQMNLAALQAGLGRIELIAQAFGQELLNLRNWHVTWIAVAVLMALGVRRLGRPAARMMLVVLVVQIASYVVAYMVTAWTSPNAEVIATRVGEGDPLQFLLVLTLGRLLMHVAPVAICLALIASPLREPGSG